MGEADRLARIMREASEAVLGGGKRVRVDTKIIRWPKRFEDEARGSGMFAAVLAELERAERLSAMLKETPIGREPG